MSHSFLWFKGRFIPNNLLIFLDKLLDLTFSNKIFSGNEDGITQSVGISQFISLFLLIDTKYASNHIGHLPKKGVIIIILFLILIKLFE